MVVTVSGDMALPFGEREQLSRRWFGHVRLRERVAVRHKADWTRRDYLHTWDHTAEHIRGSRAAGKDGTTLLTFAGSREVAGRG